MYVVVKLTLKIRSLYENLQQRWLGCSEPSLHESLFGLIPIAKPGARYWLFNDSYAIRPSTWVVRRVRFFFFFFLREELFEKRERVAKKNTLLSYHWCCCRFY